MNGDWTRQKFLDTATASAASLALVGMSRGTGAFAASIFPETSPLTGRFLTHVSVVRVNQIEVTPTRSIGADEAVDNRPERIRSRREAFARGCPEGKMAWAISWRALHDQRRIYAWYPELKKWA